MSLPSPNDSDRNVVWVVDGDHSLADALTWMDQLTDNTVRIFNVNEVVRACQNAAITNSCAVDFLAIFGHGTGGYQSTGAGKGYEDTGTKSLRYKMISRPEESLLMGPAEKYLTALNGVLSDDAEVFLVGCNVGEGDAGTGLLTTVSKILNGRTVRGFENAVYWWTNFLVGYLKEASGDTVSSSMTYMTIFPSAYLPDGGF